MASSVSSVESSAISSFFFFQAEDGIRDLYVTGVQTCALPIFPVYTVLVPVFREARVVGRLVANLGRLDYPADKLEVRSEEHTSELQSRRDLVCRLLLEKKKKKNIIPSTHHRCSGGAHPRCHRT